MISYSQNLEDVILWRALKDIKNGFYVDVGAAWPEEHSVTKTFYDNGWKGINVEPNVRHYNRLVSERERDINLQMAVGERAGNLEMTIFSDTGLSTLVPEIADIHSQNGFNRETVTVPVITLLELLEANLPAHQPIHFLKIDVEGLEEQVIKSCDWERFRPWIVVVEATLPLSQAESYEGWDHILISSGYILAYVDGLNRFYLASEHSELLPKLKYPPNVFDEYVLSKQMKLEAKLHGHQQEIKELNQEISTLQSNLAVAEQSSEDFHRRLRDIYSSTSWKITKPIRFIKRFFFEKTSRQQLIIRIKVFIRKIILRCISIISKNQEISLLSKRLLNRFPIIKQRLIRMQKSSFSSLSHYQSDSMSIRASQIYQDIKQAVENNKKDK
ncbi:FkbM family methyltransferase [Vibrio diazotrophicus]|uniref:FkbM family methyltransferase n=1 Tax=Vibrio diazotrophicus TaxID=685 RepID=A0ABX4WAJ9_VIBDI|nr:FkbM family methyltransferase [Vibrio diazotrophicus]PNI00925.1 FkbM family methyltransferase [Vibrio diazotrophicus]